MMDYGCPVCRRPIEHWPDGRIRHHVVAPGKACEGAGHGMEVASLIAACRRMAARLARALRREREEVCRG